MRHRYFVRTQYGVIKIKSLSYILPRVITKYLMPHDIFRLLFLIY
ncbi:hypothetical protein [Arsenophonus endosymbiont of Bemisia tabaci]|nr:hypothetical protein [Arsenophonus endosymbiont of Bemisia tabaci]